MCESYQHPVVHSPSERRVSQIAESLHLDLTDDEVKQYTEVMKEQFTGQFQRLADLVEPKLPVKYPRITGYRPSAKDNVLGAWCWRCDIIGASSGKLNGKTIAIKDSIPLAGIPMMNGSSILEGFIPDIDATVVTRVLDHGGQILGKATCEDLCYDGNSFTSACGIVRNPFDHTKSAGGSSSGCAVLLAKGEVDMAIGTDQGGSIRMPAACCGIVGLKPTFGLVPYTGIAPLELTLDHVGPMARTVYDSALLLECIAGCDSDGLDPRQPCSLEVPEYTKKLTGNLDSVRIGLVKEGFKSDVNDFVRNSAYKLVQMGAMIEEVSIPWHEDGSCLLAGICLGSFCQQGALMYYDTTLQLAMERGMELHSNDLSHCVTMQRLTNRYLNEDYHGIFYCKAQNLRRELKKAYDEALKRYDVLIMPTLHKEPPTLPTKHMKVREYLRKAWELNSNTGVFCVTGHPSLSINAGMSDGLPVGMMIVGKMFDESNVLNVAYAYEKIRDEK